MCKTNWQCGAESAGHILVALDAEAQDAEPFMATVELDCVKWDKANAERLTSAGKRFISVHNRRCVEFVKEEMGGESVGLEDRLLLWTKAVVLADVPALVNDTMKTHYLELDVSVHVANGVKKMLLSGMSSSTPSWPQW
jgi:hypothetical protein